MDALERVARGATVSSELNSIGSLTDSAIARIDDQLIILRGGAAPCRFFIRLVDGTYEVSDGIYDANATLRDGFIVFQMAHSTLAPFERRATMQTVYDDYSCVPPASCVLLKRNGQLQRFALDHRCARFDALSERALKEAVIAGVDNSVSRALSAVSECRPIVFEISGGMDSTVVASRTLRWMRSQKDKRHVQGVSFRYPYYEFRHEMTYIESAATHLDISTSFLDGAQALPFHDWATIASDGRPNPLSRIVGDEPALQQVGRSQRTAALVSAKLWQSLHVHGLGGDPVFGLGPHLQMIADSPPPCPRWVEAIHWKRFLREWELVRNHYPNDPEGHRQQFFSGANIDDCWSDIYLAPRLGLARVCGFTEPQILNAVARLWDIESNARSRSEYKWLMRDIFEHDIPEKIRRRTHKIAYDGLYVRGYRRTKGQLVSLVERFEQLLKREGLSPEGMIRSIDRLVRGYLDNDVLLSIVLSCLEWLELNQIWPDQNTDDEFSYQ